MDDPYDKDYPIPIRYMAIVDHVTFHVPPLVPAPHPAQQSLASGGTHSAEPSAQSEEAAGAPEVYMVAPEQRVADPLGAAPADPLGAAPIIETKTTWNLQVHTLKARPPQSGATVQ